MRTLQLILLSLTLFLSQGGYSLSFSSAGNDLLPLPPDIDDTIQNWSYPIENWMPQDTLQSEQFKAKSDKEKYRIYFEDKPLVLMVLGGLEYWNMNCGTLSKTGEYFIKLVIKKHGIDIDEMNMDESFQTGLFAATLYNDCDIFLGVVNSIGLGMMYKKNPHPVQEIIFDRVPSKFIQQ